MKVVFADARPRGGEVMSEAAALLWLCAFGVAAKFGAVCVICAAVLLTLRTSGKILGDKGKFLRGAFYVTIISLGLFSLPSLSGQIGEIANSAVRAAAVKYDVIFPLAAGGGSAAAGCFLAAAACWTVCAAGESEFVAARISAAAAMILPAVLLWDEPFCTAAAALAAVMTALPPSEKNLRSAAVILPAAAAVTAAVCLLPAENFSERAAKLIFDGKCEITQPCGKIAETPQPSGGTAALEILMDSPEAVYLHGFTGCGYADGEWQPPRTEKLPLGVEELTALAEQNFTADSQPAAAAMYGGSEFKFQKISVRRLGADGRYFYLTDSAQAGRPKFAAGLENPAGLFSDANISEFTTLCDYFTAADNAERITAAAMDSQNYRACAAALDRIYRDGGYLQLDEESERVLEAQLGEVGAVNISEAAALVGELLGGCEFDRNTQPQSAEKFLQTTRRGNSCAFASAAVLALRYCGIPARYAEGYAVTFSDAQGAPGGSAITLTADDFHAWAEYYAEGFGWVPLETVSEYFDKMPQPAAASAALRDSAERSGGAAGKEVAGERIYRRMEDEKQTGGGGKFPWSAAAALAVVLLGAGVGFAAKLRRDPLYALGKCAWLLGVGCDAGGRRDFGSVSDKELCARLENLQAYCLEKFYGRSGSQKARRTDGLALYAACLGAKIFRKNK